MRLEPSFRCSVASLEIFWPVCHAAITSNGSLFEAMTTNPSSQCGASASHTTSPPLSSVFSSDQSHSEGTSSRNAPSGTLTVRVCTGAARASNNKSICISRLLRHVPLTADQLIHADHVVVHVVEIGLHPADRFLELGIALHVGHPGVAHPRVPGVIAQLRGALGPLHGVGLVADLGVAERLAQRGPVVAVRLVLE